MPNYSTPPFSRQSAYNFQTRCSSVSPRSLRLFRSLWALRPFWPLNLFRPLRTVRSFRPFNFLHSFDSLRSVQPIHLGGTGGIPPLPSMITGDMIGPIKPPQLAARI